MTPEQAAQFLQSQADLLELGKQLLLVGKLIAFGIGAVLGGLLADV